MLPCYDSFKTDYTFESENHRSSFKPSYASLRTLKNQPFDHLLSASFILFSFSRLSISRSCSGMIMPSTNVLFISPIGPRPMVLAELSLPPLSLLLMLSLLMRNLLLASSWCLAGWSAGMGIIGVVLEEVSNDLERRESLGQVNSTYLLLAILKR